MAATPASRKQGRPPGPSLKGAATRRHVIDSAATVFAELGYDRARMSQLVEATGMTKGAVGIVATTSAVPVGAAAACACACTANNKAAAQAQHSAACRVRVFIRFSSDGAVSDVALHLDAPVSYGLDEGAVVVVAAFVARHRQDAPALGQLAVAEGLEQRRHQLAPGEVAGAAEEDQVESLR